MGGAEAHFEPFEKATDNVNYLAVQGANLRRQIFYDSIFYRLTKAGGYRGSASISAAPIERAGWTRRMRVYLAPKFLIIYEMGYLPLDDLGATICFQLVSARYERGTIILTSKKSYGDWGSIFGDPIIATAILDRQLQHSTTINIRGENYRLKDRRKAGLFPREEEETRAAPFPSSEMSQSGPRRQGSAAPLRALDRSGPLRRPIFTSGKGGLWPCGPPFVHIAASFAPAGRP